MDPFKTNDIAQSLSRLSEDQLAILLGAGSANDDTKLPQLAVVSHWLRYAADWEMQRRAGGTVSLIMPSVAVDTDVARLGVASMRICGLVALAHDVEVPRGAEAAQFYFAVAGDLDVRCKLQ